MRQAHTMRRAAQLFKSNFRTDVDIQSGAPRCIGLENEYIMISSDGTIMKPEVLENFWRELAIQGWEIIRDKETQKITGLKKPRSDKIAKRTHNYDLITTDYGYSTLEIDLAPAQSLKEAQKPLDDLLEMVTSILSKYDTYLLGYGVQPVSSPRRDYLGPKSRYQLIFDVHEEETVLNPEALLTDLHCMNAASQTQVEVSISEAIPILNALCATSGLRIALLANSSVWQNKLSDYKAIRALFWDWCFPHRKSQVGIPPKFQSFEHYVDYIADFPSIAVCRDQIFYRLNSNNTFRQFMTDESGQMGTSFNGHTARIFGSPEDIYTQYGFAWLDARLQPLHGTVEDRVSCQQPPHARFCSSALTLGLVENSKGLIEIANLLSLDQWREIRLLACAQGMAFTYQEVDIRSLIEQMLHVAREGLEMRRFGDETYLAPLYNRLKTGMCPADEVLSQFLEGGVEKIIESNDMRKIFSFSIY